MLYYLTLTFNLEEEKKEIIKQFSASHTDLYFACAHREQLEVYINYHETSEWHSILL